MWVRCVWASIVDTECNQNLHRVILQPYSSVDLVSGQRLLACRRNFMILIANLRFFHLELALLLLLRLSYFSASASLSFAFKQSAFGIWEFPFLLGVRAG